MTSNVRRRTHHRLANCTLWASNSGNSGRNPSRAGQYKPMPNETADDDQDLDDNIIHPDPPDKPTLSLEPVNNNDPSIERLGANLDPFESLPIKLHFSTLKLFEYCM